MGKPIVEPPDIQRLFDKPGRGWTMRERWRVKQWLNEAPQLDFLLNFALRHLGMRAEKEDAEDAWANYCVQRLDKTINLYDSFRGRRFWNFLLLGFSQFCWDEGEKIQRRSGREQPLERDSQEGELIEWEFAAESRDVEGVVIAHQMRAELLNCIKQLKPDYGLVIALHYMDELSVVQMATTLAISEANVKVRLFRARQQLAECLRRGDRHHEQP